MIQSREDYLYYLERDKNSLCISRKHPRFWTDEIWRFQILLRKREYLTNCKHGLFYKICSAYYHYKFKKLSLQLGFSIPINVFGPGLAIVHYGTIVVAEGAKIGANCRIHEGVTIGATNGSNDAAIIGDNVFIASGAKIIGNVRISDNVAIAANAVVVNDVISDSGCTVGGIPAKIISKNTSTANIFYLK